jgi:glycosyltransferase involved in cell wall biosynthesis
MSVILPASNEAGYIGACLRALLAQHGAAGAVEVLVVANGCRDDTAARARAMGTEFAARGWRLEVIERAEGGKTRALNAGDAAAAGAIRVYLDADVICAPGLLGQLRAALAPDRPLYATGTLEVATARSWVTRRFADLWVRLPFVTGGAVGAGLFAVNAAGRARWGEWPEIISDDTFARLHFAPAERIEVPARYVWPMVEGFGPLVRVRRRQDAGVAELRRLHPALMANEGKAGLGLAGALRLLAVAPVSFVVYLAVRAAASSRPAGAGWSRGR